MDSNKLLPWGLKLSTVALSLPVNTRYASCIATAITRFVTLVCSSGDVQVFSFFLVFPYKRIAVRVWGGIYRIM